MAVEVLERFREAQRQKEKLEEQLEADLEEAFKAGVQEAFDQAPLIGGLHWRQDGPNFCDGDVSSFCVNDPGTWSAEEPAPKFGSDEIGDESSFARHWAEAHGVELDWDREKQDWLPIADADAELSAQFVELSRQEKAMIEGVFAFQDYFEELYGDDVTVRISRDEAGQAVVKTSDDEDSYEDEEDEDDDD